MRWSAGPSSPRPSPMLAISERHRFLARIEYVEVVASRPLIVTGDNAIAYGVSLGLSLGLGFSPSLPSGGLRRIWPKPFVALLGEMKVILWVNTHLTA